MKINEKVAQEFHDLLNMKNKRTRAQNSRIREIWAAMRSLAPGRYNTSGFTYLVVSRKEAKHRKSTIAVYFRKKPVASVSAVPSVQSEPAKVAA